MIKCDQCEKEAIEVHTDLRTGGKTRYYCDYHMPFKDDCLWCERLQKNLSKMKIGDIRRIVLCSSRDIWHEYKIIREKDSNRD